jgi:dTDP-glucose 4,6-dehydratase
MKKMVVISGATGMSGNETVRKLLSKGYIIWAFDNFFASSIESIADLLEHPDLKFFQYDLCNKTQMTALETEIKSSIGKEIFELSFINYAAVVHTKYFYSPESTFQVNVLGMRDFLSMAIRLKAGIFLNCSTSEVYSMASFKEGGVREDDTLMLVTAESSQRTSYAAGKLLTEFFMKEAVEKGQIKGCSIRFANVYSNDELLPEHIIPYAIDTLLKDDTIKLLNNAKHTYRSFLHNYDSCDAVIALLETPNALDGSVYNVGTDEEISILELVKIIAKKTGREKINIVHEGERSADPLRRLLNTEKIRKKTNWTPKVSLNEGLDMCISAKKYLKDCEH